MGENLLEAAITDIIRYRIDYLMTVKNNHPNWFDDVGKIPGIKIIQKREDVPGLDCQRYLFGEGQLDISEWQPVEPVEGAIAIYEDSEGNITHFGKVTNKGKIISKWGDDSHVYEHPPLYVPHYYGKPKYYQIPTDTNSTQTL